MTLKILRHEAIGETRAVALDADGQPVALYYDRIVERGRSAYWGQVLAGRTTKAAPESGGVFVTLETGEEALLPGKDVTGVREGEACLYKITSEARAGKLAKITPAKASDPKGDKWDIWCRDFGLDPLADVISSSQSATDIDVIFQAALEETAPIPGGGYLRLSPTPALLAVDVDTAGRVDKGRASYRAKCVNIAAAKALARELCVRSEGGALVLDCVGPLSRHDGPGVKSAFIDTFRALSNRRLEALNPSPFGLMQAVIERRRRPLREAYYATPQGQPLPIAQLLQGLRALERAALADTSAHLRLILPEPALRLYRQDKQVYDSAIQKRFGARYQVGLSETDQVEAYRL